MAFMSLPAFHGTRAGATPSCLRAGQGTTDEVARYPGNEEAAVRDMEPREQAGAVPAGVDFEAARRTIGAIRAQVRSCSATEDAARLMGEVRAILSQLIPLVDERVGRLPRTSLEWDRGCDTVARARTALTWTHTGSSISYLGYVAHVADHLLSYFPDRRPEEGA